MNFISKFSKPISLNIKFIPLQYKVMGDINASKAFYIPVLYTRLKLATNIDI
jgi:hypothetical protein